MNLLKLLKRIVASRDVLHAVQWRPEAYAESFTVMLEGPDPLIPSPLEARLEDLDAKVALLSRTPEPLITLPLDVAAISADWNLAHLLAVKRAIIRAGAWWEQNLGIRLQPVLHLDFGPIYEPFLNLNSEEMVADHYLRCRPAMLSVYVVDAATLEGDLWGTSVGYHGFVVVASPFEDIIGPLIAHELGHVFEDDSIHTEGTFLRLHTQVTENVVTPEQREQMRSAALRMGGR